jgi:hypothetical protein
MPGALLRGASTREYQEALPQMAAVGVSRSAISRNGVTMAARHALAPSMTNRYLRSGWKTMIPQAGQQALDSCLYSNA